MMILATRIANDWGIDIPQIPLVGCAPEWMSEKAVSIGNYVVATGIDTFLGVSPQIKGSDKVWNLYNGGLTDWVGASFHIIEDIDKLGDAMMECIESKRTALNI